RALLKHAETEVVDRLFVLLEQALEGLRIALLIGVHEARVFLLHLEAHRLGHRERIALLAARLGRTHSAPLYGFFGLALRRDRRRWRFRSQRLENLSDEPAILHGHAPRREALHDAPIVGDQDIGQP